MCSIGDDVFENESNKVMVKEQTKASDTCNKCRIAKAFIVLRHKDVYCKNCFLTGTTHKFKAILGKSKLIRPKDNVLVYHKLGHPSTALLHFLRTGLDLSTPKKFRFELQVLFIEDQFDLTVEERKEFIRKVKEEVASYNFKLRCISFTKYITQLVADESIDRCSIFKDGDDYLEIFENDRDKVLNVLDKKISKTDRNQVMNVLRRNLLIDAAEELKCNFVFTPEISVDTASSLLTNICLGRGSNVSVDTGFCDDRNSIKILRPLRLFDMKELAFYNRLNNLEPLSVRQRGINPYRSVQNLMMKFVNDLQENYPATVTTVLRTGDKLISSGNKNMTCKFCKGTLVEKNNVELTAEDSVKFSHLVSTVTPNNTISGQERYQNILDKFNNCTVSNNEYCYACSKISSFIKT